MIDPSQALVEFRRLLRFGTVGIIVTLVYSATTVIAVEVLHLDPIAATTFGQVVATGISYFGHSIFSFGVKTDHGTYLWRFGLIAASSYLSNVAITWLLTDFFQTSYRVSVAVVIILIPLTNYICNRYWVFGIGLRDVSAASNASPSRDSVPKF